MSSLKSDVREAARQCHDLSVRLARIADQLPEPTTAKIEEAFHSDHRKVGRDRDGKRLRVGDLVRVYDSERYGNPIAVVLGPGDDLGDGKKRVHVALRNGQDDNYNPSTARVQRLGRPAVGSEPSKANMGETDDASGYTRVGGFTRRSHSFPAAPATFPNITDALAHGPIIIGFSVGDALEGEPTDGESNGPGGPGEFSVRIGN